MRLANINENRFQRIHNKFKILSKERQGLENKRFWREDKIKSLKWKKNKELREQKKIHSKADKEFRLRTKNIIKKIDSDSSDAYNKIRFKLDPDANKVIAGEKFERELSKFKNVQKTHIRTLMIARNKYIKIIAIQPRKIRIKYNNRIDNETEKNKKLTNDIWNYSKKTEPYLKAVQTTANNRKKINRNKKEIREINRKIKKLEKVKIEWKGMQYADDYYDKKEKHKDKFITLDLKKEKLEVNTNKIARETNKKLFDTRL